MAQEFQGTLTGLDSYRVYKDNVQIGRDFDKEGATSLARERDGTHLMRAFRHEYGYTFWLEQPLPQEQSS